MKNENDILSHDLKGLLARLREIESPEDTQSLAEFLIGFADTYARLALRCLVPDNDKRSFLKQDGDGTPTDAFVKAFSDVMRQLTTNDPIGASAFLNAGNLRFAFLFPNLDVEERGFLAGAIFHAECVRRGESPNEETNLKRKQHFEATIMPKLTAVQMAILKTGDYNISDALKSDSALF